MMTAVLAAAPPPQGPPAVVPPADLAAAATASVAAVAPAVAALEVGAISHITAFEAACANKKITQDGSKYSKLVSVLTQEATSRMVGHLPEPGTNADDYARTKERLKMAYTKTQMERCAELMSITSLGESTCSATCRDSCRVRTNVLCSVMSGLLPFPTPSTRCSPRTTAIWRPRGQGNPDDEGGRGKEEEARADQRHLFAGRSGSQETATGVSNRSAAS